MTTEVAPYVILEVRNWRNTDTYCVNWGYENLRQAEAALLKLRMDPESKGVNFYVLKLAVEPVKNPWDAVRIEREADRLARQAAAAKVEACPRREIDGKWADYHKRLNAETTADMTADTNLPW